MDNTNTANVALTAVAEEPAPVDTRKYIIRAAEAGVFFGEILRREGAEVQMANVRRLWYWDGAASLSEMAVSGVKKPDDCKFTVRVPEMTILGVIEVIPCSADAARIIDEVPEWTA